MRVLLIPEVYRRDDLSANGTVADAVAWVVDWLERDPALHVYWLLPPRETTEYAPADGHADRDRVTLLEAEPYGAALEPTEMFTEGGYSEAELRAIDRGIRESGAYVDGRRAGRRTLVKWLHEGVDQWAARVRPFDVVSNVHDLQIPQKYRYCSYRNEYQGRMELCETAFADGIWFTAPVDAPACRSSPAVPSSTTGRFRPGGRRSPNATTGTRGPRPTTKTTPGRSSSRRRFPRSRSCPGTFRGATTRIDGT